MKLGYKILIGLGCLLLLGLVTIYVADSILHLGLFSHNSIEVSSDGGLDPKKIVIKKGLWSINRDSDIILFDNSHDEEVVFKEGNSWGLDTDYGENDLLIIYDNTYYYQFRHFILNRGHQHDYRFHLSKENGKIIVSINIEGPDGMQFSRPMNLISDASKLRTNVPIDDAGTIYNMKELE